MKRSLALSAAVVAVGTAVLAGCSSSGSTAHSSGHSMGMSSGSSSVQAGAAASGPHNSTDQTFASDMIPHHRQAVEMADMALSTSKNAQVLTLAKEIKAAQDPEIATMTGWLNGWNSPVPSTSMSHDGMSMPGMMSTADMTALKAATGTAFDKLWLTMMIAHHNGAVTMSKTELANGQNPDAKTLATSIIASQSREISQMNSLLAGL